MAKKLDQTLLDILIKYGEKPESALWDCHGTWVAYHAAIERIAARAGIEFELPQVIEARSADKTVAIAVRGKMGERAEWSFGEAAPANNKNAYPYAMAEKRAKDRVTLKLVGLHGLVYSEEESDDFKPDTAQKRVSSASLKREEDPRGDKIWTQVRNEMAECQSTVKLRALFKEWRAKAEKDNWPRAWINTLESDFKHEAELIKKREEAAVETQDDVFPGDREPINYLMAG